MKTIKILWTGCPNCIRLETNVKNALEKTWIQAHVEKITDITDIMTYWVMWTPSLIINEKVVSSGKVNEIDEIIELLNWWESDNSEKNLVVVELIVNSI